MESPGQHEDTMVESPPSSFHPCHEEELKLTQSEGQPPVSLESPSQTKLAFGMKKMTVVSTNSHQSSVVAQTKSKVESVFAIEDNDVEQQPKKKLVPIEYSDDEEEGTAGRRSGEASGSWRPSGRAGRNSRDERSGARKDGKSGGEVGIVAYERNESGDVGVLGAEEGARNRKLPHEERKKLVQQLVGSIPTVKEEVFQYDLKWHQIDRVKCVSTIFYILF